MIKKYILVTFYLTVLFPFVSFLPTNTDLQPAFIILAIITATFSYRKFLFFDRTDIVLMIAGVLSLMYFNIFHLNAPLTKGFSSYISLFIAIFFLLVFKKTFNLKIFISVLKVSIIIYFVSSLLFFFYTSFFTIFQGYLVRSINTINEGIGYRGISTYFTEPGLFGAHMVAFLVFLLSFYKKNIIDTSSFIIFSLMCFIMVLMSKSGMGYSYAALFIILASYKKKVIIIPLILILVFSSFYNFNSIIEFNRGFLSLQELSNYKSISDNSILKRLNDFLLGIVVFSKNIFGCGVNIDSSVFQNIISDNVYFSKYYNFGRPFGFVSSFSFYLVSYGFWFILLILFMLYRFKPSFIDFIFFCFFLSFSFSGAYPIIWIILIMRYLLNKKHVMFTTHNV